MEVAQLILEPFELLCTIQTTRNHSKSRNGGTVSAGLNWDEGAEGEEARRGSYLGCLGARRPGGRASGRALARRSPPPARAAPPSAPAVPPPPSSSAADPELQPRLRLARWRRGPPARGRPPSAARPTTPSAARLKRAPHSSDDNGRGCLRVRCGERLSLSLLFAREKRGNSRNFLELGFVLGLGARRSVVGLGWIVWAIITSA